MIEAAPAPGAPVPARVSRVWQIVLIIVAAQVLLVVLGIVAFAALGFADEPTGCGGG